jgi:hypothetical protein
MSDNAFTSLASGVVRVGGRKSIRPAAKERQFRCYDPSGRPGDPRDEFALPVGHHLIWDIRCLADGRARMKKGAYAEWVSPLGQPEPPLPPGVDPSELQPITVSQAWVDGLPDRPAALRRMSISGVICLNAMATLYQMAGYKREAQEGLLPVLEIHPFQDVETSYGVFGAPVMEIIGWIERNTDIFGPANIAAPVPVIGGSQPAPQIEPPAADPQPAEPVPVTAASAKDPLAKFRPVPGKKPY